MAGPQIAAVATAPSASYSLTVRLEIRQRPGMLGRVTSAIGAAGGDIGAVDLVETTRDRVVRDLTINCRDSEHGQEIVNLLGDVAGVRVVKELAGVDAFPICLATKDPDKIVET